MEDNKYLHKFNGKPGEDFALWSAKTEAGLEATEVYHVVSTDVLGEGAAALNEE